MYMYPFLFPTALMQLCSWLKAVYIRMTITPSTYPALGSYCLHPAWALRRRTLELAAPTDRAMLPGVGISAHVLCSGYAYSLRGGTRDGEKGEGQR